MLHENAAPTTGQYAFSHGHSVLRYNRPGHERASNHSRRAARAGPPSVDQQGDSGDRICTLRHAVLPRLLPACRTGAPVASVPSTGTAIRIALLAAFAVVALEVSKAHRARGFHATGCCASRCTRAIEGRIEISALVPGGNGTVAVCGIAGAARRGYRCAT